MSKKVLSDNKMVALHLITFEKIMFCVKLCSNVLILSLIMFSAYKSDINRILFVNFVCQHKLCLESGMFQLPKLLMI